ncbi:MAG: D-tyrosyl-tRNA(Tyr) deacylase [Oscillospiraceae bacterium]|nr:D-tyrosyl-tRNA(Tyr) deacylase [Oscillospiraceae bacterium]
MRAIIQRVSSASVAVDGNVCGSIDRGFLIFVGFTHTDTRAECDKMAKKISAMRIFSDENDKINLSLSDVGGQILCISQFTLYADCSHGNRPAFINAMQPHMADELYGYFCDTLSKTVHVEKGIFGADMKVTLVNDGPFTISLEY